MYIPTWLIIIIAVVAFLIWKSKKKFERPASVEDIEKSTQFLKERLFELEHLDSPHFIDYQDAFDAMEVNYLRLKQRFSHTPEKVLENAKDRAGESMKEPSIIREEVEKKFKFLLGEDWQEIPPDYFKRMDTMGKSESAKKGLGDDWKYYYRDSANFFNLEEKR